MFSTLVFGNRVVHWLYTGTPGAAECAIEFYVSAEKEFQIVCFILRCVNKCYVLSHLEMKRRAKSETAMLLSGVVAVPIILTVGSACLTYHELPLDM